MNSFQKYLLVLLFILVVSISYYFISNANNTIIEGGSFVQSENKIKTVLNNDMPDEYHIRIVHAGGEGIRTRTTEVIGIGDGEEYYLNEPNYSQDIWAPSFMNNAGDLIWLSCNEGYKIKKCWSDSTDQVSINDTGSCGIVIDKTKIFGRLECIKSNKDSILEQYND